VPSRALEITVGQDKACFLLGLSVAPRGFEQKSEFGYWEAAYDSSLRAPMDEGQRAWMLGGYYSRLGQVTESLAWAEKAVELHAINAVNLNIAPEYDQVRDLPGFKKLVRRIGLPER
jgi:hypothetical protein